MIAEALARAAPLAGGLALDRALGEPPAALHPVVGLGRLLGALESALPSGSRPAGLAHAATGAATSALAGAALRAWLGPAAATTVGVGVASAGRMLEHEARAVVAALDAGDPGLARRRLAGLVGRSTDDLDEAEIVRAVVESLVENTLDAVTATIWWAALAGAVGACAHRAVDVMDSMVGHRSDRHARYGWASARLDDAAAWLPARLTAAAIVVVAPGRRRAAIGAIRRDARRHPSPNGGVVEAAAAGALGVRLGGVNRYGDRVEDRGTLGTGPPPGRDDVERAIGLLRRATAVVLVASAAIAVPIRRLACAGAARAGVGRARRRRPGAGAGRAGVATCAR